MMIDELEARIRTVVWGHVTLSRLSPFWSGQSVGPLTQMYGITSTLPWRLSCTFVPLSCAHSTRDQKPYTVGYFFCIFAFCTGGNLKDVHLKLTSITHKINCI